MSSVLKKRWMPIRIRNPKPPSPMRAVTVTRPIVLIVATRTPAMMTAVASGTSTRQNRSRAVYPMPVAASRTSAGTSRIPRSMLRMRMRSV